MRIIPVALAIFYEKNDDNLRVWVQTREDDGPFHGLQEFPGGGIESNESPLEAVIREVSEEVGISIDEMDGKFFGVYSNIYPTRTIALHVYLFPRSSSLEGKGQWLTIQKDTLSSPYAGIIPPPNHKIIDDLFLALLS